MDTTPGEAAVMNASSTVRTGERLLEVRDVGFGLGHPLARHRTVARGSIHVETLHAGVVEVVARDVRMLEDVAQLRPVGFAAETREPFGHVGGVARLAHLAVADDVDAGLLLALDDFAHRVAHALGEQACVDVASFLLWRTSARPAGPDAAGCPVCVVRMCSTLRFIAFSSLSMAAVDFGLQ